MEILEFVHHEYGILIWILGIAAACRLVGFRL